MRIVLQNMTDLQIKRSNIPWQKNKYNEVMDCLINLVPAKVLYKQMVQSVWSCHEASKKTQYCVFFITSLVREDSVTELPKVTRPGSHRRNVYLPSRRVTWTVGKYHETCGTSSRRDLSWYTITSRRLDLQYQSLLPLSRHRFSFTYRYPDLPSQ